MTDKELRKLKRAELLEILYYLQKEVDDLKKEKAELKQRLETNDELPEKALKQIGETVRTALGDYFGKTPVNERKEKSNGKNKKNKQSGGGK